MITKELNSLIKEAFVNAGYQEVEPKWIVSNRPDLCDYQCDTCFTMAKLLKTNPFVIAENVFHALEKLPLAQQYFEKMEVVRPGFINVTLSNQFLAHAFEVMSKEEKFGLAKPEKQETYFLDYGGPNVAKPLHVGHLRSAILGESVKRIIDYCGHTVMSDVHLGDYGLQIGQVIYGALQDGVKPSEITLEYLDETYPRMSALCKEDELVKADCAEITKQLQEGNEKYQEYFRVIREISSQDIKRIYDYIDVHFDYWMGESHSYLDIPKAQQYLEQQNLLYTSFGARVMDIAKEGDKTEIPPFIFQKSNGAYLYSSTDYATVMQRIRDHKPDHILYFADLRQAQHFDSVFRACEKSGLVKNGVPGLEFCGFGTVNGTDGRPYKTRAGDSPKLDSLFNQVKEVFVATKESNQSAKPEDLDKIVNAIIKFADLQNAKERDYIFDIQKFSSIVGKTGPYILYTYLRLNNIVSNNAFDKKSSGAIYNQSDRDLRLELLRYPLVMQSALAGRSPSTICDYLYRLCTVANTFYEANRIGSLTNKIQKDDWCNLVDCTAKLIKTLLNLVIIDTPSVM